jgi:hypothetical protein
VSFQQVAAPPPPPGPVDLDRVEAEAGQFVADGWVARNVPGLVAEVKRLRAEVEEWKMTAMAGAEVLADRDAESRVARATVVRLDTELRAAREVVELARQHATGHEPYPLPGLSAALDAYDRAVSES